MSILRWVMLLSVAMAVGCSQQQSESVTPVADNPKQDIQSTLESIAKTGQAGSEMGLLMEKINKLSESDPALATSLREDADQLMKLMSEHKDMKAKAQEMLKKLGAQEPSSSGP